MKSMMSVSLIAPVFECSSTSAFSFMLRVEHPELSADLPDERRLPLDERIDDLGCFVDGAVVHHSHEPRRGPLYVEHLTADTGNTHLDRQISTVTTLMRISENKHQFETLFERAFPPVAPRLPLIIEAVDGIYPLPSHE
jgi:hypothetical protein